MTKPVLGILAAALTGVQVGAAIFVTRQIVGDIGPMTLAFLRYALAVGCIVPIYLARQRVTIPQRDTMAIMCLGVVQFAALVGFLNLGLKTVPAGRAAILFAVFPVFALLAAWLMRRETIDLPRAVGVCISILAVSIIINDQNTEYSNESMAGNIAILTAALFGGASAVLYRPYLARYPTIQVGTLAMAAATFVLFPFALAEGGWNSLTEANILIGVAFIGFSSAIGYLLWLTALKLINASTAATLLNLSPVVALYFGWLFLNEPVGINIWAGLVFMSMGLWLVLRTTAHNE